MGNAVGSIICDTGLILGVACLLAPLKLNRKIVNRQGWIQFGAGVALVAVSFPWLNPAGALTVGGRMPQWIGFLFLCLLAFYMWQSVRWAREEFDVAVVEDHEKDTGASLVLVVLKLAGAIALVVISARVLIPTVAEAATRLSVPESIIAATLVAFGTSLPELITAVTAARRGHGDLAIGNIVGADILNVLFVAGAAAAVTPQGLEAGPHFFMVLFPIMLCILLVFRAGIFFSDDYLRKPFGFVLLGAYSIYLIISYLIRQWQQGTETSELAGLQLSALICPNAPPSAPALIRT